MQENEDLIQQINFIDRLDINVNANANVFIIIEKKENTILEFSQNFANVLYKTKVQFVELINNGKSKDNQFIKLKRY